ncbi:hypothetical protein [Amycolatopsis orientalis]|uniref:hypothetical protein n=1 Tax=Amycolatopsis orientalis TaxID=31958 RepID=UPI00126886EC|nr:hypothetical protein [Amycolatopsis orientalis]
MRKSVISIGAVAAVAGLSVAPSASASPGSVGQGKAGTFASVVIPAKRIPVDNRFIPPRVGGDDEFNGHGPDVFANSTLEGVGTNRLRVRIFMDAIETRADFTHVRGTSPDFLIYVAPAGQCVQSVSRGGYEEIRYRDTDHAVDVFAGQVTDSFVSEWSFVGDTNSSEAGTRTGVALTTFSFVANVQPC